MNPTQEQIDDASKRGTGMHNVCTCCKSRDALLAAYRAKCEELEAMKSKEFAMPDLLVALKECVRDLKQGMRDGEVDGDNFGYHQAVAAIARVEGKEHCP